MSRGCTHRYVDMDRQFGSRFRFWKQIRDVEGGGVIISICCIRTSFTAMCLLFLQKYFNEANIYYMALPNEFCCYSADIVECCAAGFIKRTFRFFGWNSPRSCLSHSISPCFFIVHSPVRVFFSPPTPGHMDSEVNRAERKILFFPPTAWGTDVWRSLVFIWKVWLTSLISILCAHLALGVWRKKARWRDWATGVSEWYVCWWVCKDLVPFQIFPFTQGQKRWLFS